MPLYNYQVVTPAGDGAVLEILQPLGAAPLANDPFSGRPVKKLITAPNLPLKHGQSAEKNKLSDAHLTAHGFARAFALVTATTPSAWLPN